MWRGLWSVSLQEKLSEKAQKEIIWTGRWEWGKHTEISNQQSKDYILSEYA